MYRTGFCGGETNEYVCSDHADCRESQYITAHTSFTLGNCVNQPTCPKDNYLTGTDVDKEGRCVPCKNSVCPADTWRSGMCQCVNLLRPPAPPYSLGNGAKVMTF